MGAADEVPATSGSAQLESASQLGRSWIRCLRVGATEKRGSCT